MSARVSPIGFAALVAAGGAAPLVSWWTTTSFGPPGALATNVGRLAALAAGYGVLVQLLLRARIPAVERGLGVRVISQWHATGGALVLTLVWLHVLLVTLGYAQVFHASYAEQAWSLVTDYRHTVQAAVALLCLTAVGLVSFGAIRRRMPYEGWHLVHLLVYPGVALAFAHQVVLGNQLRQTPWLRELWTTAYVAVGVTLLWYRFLTPLRRFLRHRFRVLRVEPLTTRVTSVVLGGRDLRGVHASAGQFVRLRFLTPGLWWAANPYSLSAAPTDGCLRVTAKAVGRHSAALRSLRPGTRVIVEGPNGGFTAERVRRAKVLLVAGGIGVTPLRALLEELPGGAVTMLYRAGSPEELVLHDELTALARSGGHELHCLVGHRADLPADPLGEESLLRLVPDVTERDVYLCGPPGMVEAVSTTLRRLGLPSQHLFVEAFAL